MAQQIRNRKSIKELSNQTVEQVLRDVVLAHEPVIVTLEDGEVVEIRPAGDLKPLPKLEGRVPEGWKDAIY